MRTESQAMTNGTTRRWVKWLIVTLVLAVIAFLASPNGPLGMFWGPSAEVRHPAGVQLGLLVLLNMGGGGRVVNGHMALPPPSAGLEIGDGTAEVMKVIVARELMGRESLPY